MHYIFCCQPTILVHTNASHSSSDPAFLLPVAILPDIVVFNIQCRAKDEESFRHDPKSS